MTRLSQRDTPRRSEHAEQAALIQIVRLHEAQYPDLRWLFAVPNGGARDAITGARMKAEGQKRGVSDLLLPVRRGSCGGMAIEMKIPGGRLSPEQAEWLQHFMDEGWLAAVCYSADDAWAALKSYVELPK